MKPKLISLKNNLLALLLCALMMPPVAILLVAAFAHFNQEKALDNLVHMGRLLPVMIAAAFLGSFFAIRFLWRCLISPLKDLASEIDGFCVGKDLPNKLAPQAVREIERVHSALTRFAQAAIDRDSLHNRYIRDIVQVQETERMDMAREIHDGPLQDIMALLQQVHMAVEEGGYSLERVKKTEQLARVVVRELRGLCDELSPPWVDLGLSQAMIELAERLSQNYDIHISVDIDDSFNPGAEQTLSLLRIFQEAVSNAVRHGNATEIHASMREEEGRVIFEIKDNGKGFDTEFDHQALRLEGHRGLANITERMFLMGGTFEVRSAEGEGTTIICTLGGDV
jgi:signal transduction histidine kinase